MLIRALTLASSKNPSSSRAALAAILALSAALRFTNLLGAPGWYHDECVFVGQTANFLRGEFVWEALRHTFLPRLPLNYLTIGAAMLVFGKSLLAVRALTASYGVSISLVLYFTGKECGSAKAGLWAAFFYAVCPYCILMNRWGFTYNLLSLLFALALLGGLATARAPTWKSKSLAAGAAAGAMILEPLGVAIAAFVFLLFLAVHRRRLWAWTIAMGIPISAYLAFLYLSQRELFLDDVSIIREQRLEHKILPEFFVMRFVRQIWLHQSGWTAFGFLGLLAIRQRRAFATVALCLGVLCLVLIKATGADIGLLHREMIALMPLACLGLGALAVHLAPRIASLSGEGAASRGRSRWPGRVAQGAIILYLTAQAVASLAQGLPNDQDPLCIHEPAAAKEAAQFVAARVKPDDVVLTTHIGWMLPCRYASMMQMSLLEGGKGYAILPADRMKGRFVFDCSLAAARFVVTDEATPAMCRDVPDLPGIMERVRHEWKAVFRAGSFTVFEKQAAAASSQPRGGGDGAIP